MFIGDLHVLHFEDQQGSIEPLTAREAQLRQLRVRRGRAVECHHTLTGRLVTPPGRNTVLRARQSGPIFEHPTGIGRALRSDLRTYAANLIPGGGIKRFCIVTTSRTGSELLVDLLDAHPAIRCQSEIMNERPRWPYLFARGRARRARRLGLSAYGFKLVSTQLINFFGPPDRELGRRLAADGFRFIYLRRRNLLKQAISVLRAHASELWHARNESAPNAAADVDIAAVFFQMRLHELHDAGLEYFLEGLPTLPLWYEDHLERGELHQATVDEVCSYVGIATSPVDAQLRRTSTGSLETDIANFDEVRRHLQGTRYERFLDA